jgi:hypothetical protein
MKSVIAIPLREFLSLPNIEGSPAWELINGCAIQKPMPTLFHSRLQRNLVNYINLHSENLEAVQEWRCIVPPFSPVPDISVVLRSRLPEEDGPLNGAPDWLIEIRSIESREGITPRPSQLDPGVRLSPHPAPDNLIAHAPCGYSRGSFHESPSSC